LVNDNILGFRPADKRQYIAIKYSLINTWLCFPQPG
jgi:hypothetical protein